MRKILFVLALIINLSSFAQHNKPYYVTLDNITDNCLILYIHNNTDSTAYLFDTYLQQHDIAEVPYFHRYREKQDEYILSFLPFQQYLSLFRTHGTRLSISGKYMSRDGLEYQFTEIPAHDSTRVVLPTDILKSDIYFYDVDLKLYNFMKSNEKLEKEREEWMMNKREEYLELHKGCDTIPEEVEDEFDLECPYLEIINYEEFNPLLSFEEFKSAQPKGELAIEFAVYPRMDIYDEIDRVKRLNLKYMECLATNRSLDKAFTPYDIVSFKINLNEVFRSKR